MSGSSTTSRDDLTPDEEVLADFIREIERLGPDAVDLSPWLRQSPHIEPRLRQLLQMYRALEGTRPEPPPSLPERLGDFRIVRRIAGHLGDVYEAVQEPLGRRVAVKTIRRGRISPELEARFLREQQVLAALHQTHIIPIHTAGHEGGLQYFAMPYIDGAALNHVVSALDELQSSHPGSQTPGLRDLARIATDTVGGDMPTVTHVGAIRLSQPHPRPHPSNVRRRLSNEYVRSVARVMADVAEAVHHAHLQGILHRDIKPSNIMVDTQEQCWIIDFGLANYQKQTNLFSNIIDRAPDTNGVLRADGLADAGDSTAVVNDAALTKTADILGTPAYMAPEQFAGEADVRTDVWGLGATLYELLTLQRPFAGTSMPALEEAVRRQTPPRPRTLVDGLPADLEAICAKAMQKEPSRRYQSTTDLADDLRRFLRDEPITARPIRAPRRIWKWARRNKGTATALFAFGAAMIAAAIVLFIMERNRFLVREGEWLRKVAEAQRIRQTQHRSGWSKVASTRIDEAARIRPDSTVRDEATACLAGMDAEKLKDWSFRSSSVAFNSNGTHLLVGGGIEGNTRIWNAEADVFQESQQPGFGPVLFKLDGDGLQWATETPWSFVLWNVSQQLPVFRVNAPLPDGVQPPDDPGLVQRLAFRVTQAMSRDGALVAASVPIPDVQGKWTEDLGATFVWNNRGELQRRIDGAASGLCFSPDNALLAVGHAHGGIDIVSLAEDRVVATLRSSENRVQCFDFLADPVRSAGSTGWLLAAGDAGGTVVVWDVTRRFPRARCLGSQYNVYAVTFGPDGMTLASGGRDGVRLWDTLTGKPILHIAATGDFINGLAFSIDGGKLAISSQGPPSTAKVATMVWSIQRGRGIDLLHGLSSQIVMTCLSADGQRLVAMGQNWEIGVFELDPPKLKHLLQGPVGFTADNAALAISNDNERLAASSGSEARLWNLATGELTSRLKLPPGLVDQLAFTPDGRLLSFRSECQDGRTAPMSDAHPKMYPRVLRLRNLLGDDPLKPLAEISRFNWHVFSAAAHPQGEFFVAEGLHRGPEGDAPEIIAFDSRTGEPVWRHTPAPPIESKMLILDPMGGTLGFRDSSRARAFQVRLPTGEVIAQASPAALALGPNGDTALSDGYRLFDGAFGPGLAWSRRESQTPTVVLGIDFMIHSISPRFSRDGRLLVFGTQEGLVAVCDLPQIIKRLSDFGTEKP